MKPAYLLFIAGSSFFVAASVVSESCYDPSGSLTSDTPCNTTTSTGHSACCSKGRQCMTSGLCFDHGLIIRGSCTDPTFKDASCAPYCVDWNPKSTSAVVPRRWTTGGGVPNVGWCCGFPLSNGSCAQGFEIKVQAGQTFETYSAEPPSNTTRPNTDAQCAGKHAVVIGVGVGVPALIAIVTLLALWLWERRRRSVDNLASSSQEAADQASYPVSSYTASRQTGGLDFVSPLLVKQTPEMDGVTKHHVSEVDGTTA